ncbi:MAG: eukaryotic translation initiation factor 4E [Vezdaea acicularis]|nr:MAG: eukaryotic translation initiation factor 4E [Vezdaea acicularis]
MSTLAPSASPVPLDTLPITPTSPVEPDNENADKPKNDVTVFHDPENFTVKHPLMHKWTLWFTKPPSGKGDNWQDLLKDVITFDSVEEFWGIHNNISPPSILPQKSDYHLFHYPIRPEWEDTANKHGGKWAYQFRNKAAVPIDELWLHVMLAAIGETLEVPSDAPEGTESKPDGKGEVLGVVVNIRKGFYRIGVWTRTIGDSGKGGKGAKKDGGDQEQLKNVGRRFKEVLQLGAGEVVEFSGHADSAHSGSSRAKARISV